MSRETASEAIRLPTVAEIVAATELISAPDAPAKVVQVNERFAVKMGHGVPLVEAENMRFLAANSKVPVPKVYAAFRDPDTNKAYIIMEYLPGDTLQKLLPSLDPVEKLQLPRDVGDMKLAIIEKLRQTESDQYIRLLRNTLDRTLNGHRTVFTHVEFWEFCNATIACRFKLDWLELVPDILEQCPVEFLMMQVVYSSVCY
ncbi:uncharacterized protein BJX67DRAFT_373642 [Aspergillus lucknowensis]|uniref:Aminoglycoside phosphotransferase domain-containing protein n=1 Tax=Aspergillus lucknowensis TaxID=176173 RepID=A0ABR4LJZ7_9EURO